LEIFNLKKNVTGLFLWGLNLMDPDVRIQKLMLLQKFLIK
jgi:hypothetical protein